MAETLVCNPCYALLPGRTRWLHLHCPNLGYCDDCLQTIADFLAFEMGYDLMQAVARSTRGYQAELGEDICSMDRARRLRLMTCAACEDLHTMLVADDDAGELLRGVDVAALPRQLPVEVKRGLWMLVAICTLLSAVVR